MLADCLKEYERNRQSNYHASDDYNSVMALVSVARPMRVEWGNGASYIKTTGETILLRGNCFTIGRLDDLQ